MGALVAIPVVAAVQAVIETYGHGYELVEEPGEESPPAPPSEDGTAPGAASA